MLTFMLPRARASSSREKGNPVRGGRSAGTGKGTAAGSPICGASAGPDALIPEAGGRGSGTGTILYLSAGEGAAI